VISSKVQKLFQSLNLDEEGGIIFEEIIPDKAEGDMPKKSYEKDF
jgi:hypothetical protein